MSLFMWIFYYYDFSLKEIIEISDYDINVDEETNANSIINVSKETEAQAKDIVAIKLGNDIVYWGIIESISSESGNPPYEYIIKYITNMFDQDVILENEDLIKTTGVEDFNADAITNNFIDNEDTFVNKEYLELEVKTHTAKQTTVSNVENNIYNLHTWLTNCTQNYDIVYDFSISDKKLIMTIENKEIDRVLIDVNAQFITDYTEVYETDITAKVVVLTSTDTYTLYLLSDRTTTTDMTDENRAEGKTETIYTEDYDDAEQSALDIIKGNSYNHNITFTFNTYMKLGTPITIKTKQNIIWDTYISAIRITPNKFYEYTCGNIRIDFLDKIKKERG